MFSQQEINHLHKFLPDTGDKNQILQDLLSGSNFCFGNPLNIFLKQLQAGHFTKSRIYCDKIEEQLAKNQLISHYRNLLQEFEKREQMGLKRKRIRTNFSPTSSFKSEPSIQKQIKTNQENQSSDDEALSTNSSQSLSPLAAPSQQNIQPPITFLPSSGQSLFINAPISVLPAYTSTSLLTNQMTLACMQAKKQIKKTTTGTSNNAGQSQSKLKLESNIPTGQSNREWLESYWKQEKERYQNPLNPYTFTCLDGSKATVAPAAKKLLMGVGSKPRQHELLKNDRPPYVTILSLVRDAAAQLTRLPKSYGTRADIMNLVKDSQFINENLPDEKMSSIISGALDRLHQSTDPCVKYDQEKKIWIYLHHDRDETYPDWQQSAGQKQGSKNIRKQQEMMKM